MMKKWIAMLMAMMMLLTVVPSFAEDDEDVQTVVEVLYIEAAGEQV